MFLTGFLFVVVSFSFFFFLAPSISYFGSVMQHLILSATLSSIVYLFQDAQPEIVCCVVSG